MLAIASVINELSLNFRQKQVREVTHQLLDMMKGNPIFKPPCRHHNTVSRVLLSRHAEH